MDWEKLVVDYSFEFPKIAKSAFLKSASTMEKIDNTLFVVDNLKHEIRIFRLNANGHMILGQEGNGPGDFQFPRSIAFSETRYFVSDNNGIEVFDKDLYFIKRVRPFLNVTTLCILGKNIYCNAMDSYRNRFPLVFRLDLNGRIEKCYIDEQIEGSRLRLDKEGRIFSLGDMIVFVPINWNQIYFLDTNLGLIKKLALDYPLLDVLQEWNTSIDSLPDLHSVWLCNMVAAAKTFEGKIFILLNVPRLEILEVSSEGKVVTHFYDDEYFRQMNWIDFAIDRINNSIKFYVLGNSIREDKPSADFNIYRLHGDKSRNRQNIAERPN